MRLIKWCNFIRCRSEILVGVLIQISGGKHQIRNTKHTVNELLKVLKTIIKLLYRKNLKIMTYLKVCSPQIGKQLSKEQYCLSNTKLIVICKLGLDRHQRSASIVSKERHYWGREDNDMILLSSPLSASSLSRPLFASSQVKMRGTSSSDSMSEENRLQPALFC